VNAQTERLFGWSRIELLGKPVETLIPSRFGVSHVMHRSQYFALPGVRPMGAGLELFGRHKDGREFPVEISLSPLEMEEGLLVASAIRDITDRKRAEADRAHLIREPAARAEAESANRIKDEFLMTLSHELRTPLNAILGWVQILRSGWSGDATEALETISRNAQAQVQLVEDLLDVSRIVSGKLRLDSEPVDLQQVANQAIEVVRTAASAKQVELLQLFDGSRPIIKGDPDRIRQIVWNLLSNAVKFTPRGGRVEIRISPAAHHAVITVHDTGAGIPREFLPHLFERFRQQDSSTTRQYGGLGLGLAIVRHLAELQGGTVAGESGGEGCGATFTVTLPLFDLTAAPPLQPPRSAGEVVDLNGTRVLVVDDRMDERLLFEFVLTHAGAEVRTASGGSEATKIFDVWRPDVLVTDIAMPDEDGYTLLSRLRAQVPGLPAIAVTAHARQEDRERALSAGFNLYVAKPVDPIRLTEVVDRVARHLV
jgi:PAS domain S-box-containing protein